MRVQFATSSRYRELPAELDALGISFPDNSQDFRRELVDSWDASQGKHEMAENSISIMLSQLGRLGCKMNSNFEIWQTPHQ